VSENYILSIDQGTTSSRALVVDQAGRVVGAGQEPFPQIYPQPGWVEHNPIDIWESTQAAIGTALAAANAHVGDVAAIGIANQRETLVVWDRDSGEPVANAIVWQDRRTAPICDELREAGHEGTVAAATGLSLDPYFTGTKLTWLLRERPELRERAELGEILAGTVDSWLIWQLTGGGSDAVHATDFTNASRTLLFNIRKGRWDDELCELFEVPRAMLPKARPSRASFGRTSADVMGASIPITGVAGDQQAALFGQVCTRAGQAKCTYGTGAFLLSPAGTRPVQSKHRLLVSLGPNTGAAGPEYVLEGSIFVAGAVVEWLRDGLGLFERSGDVEALAASVADTGGVTFVPAFTGLGAPHWDPNARGTLMGLTRGSTSAHIARAALEAVALSTAELVGAMNADLAEAVAELRVDGGASRNDLLMQMQADIAGIPVVRPTNVETTAMGAAYLAGLGTGIWSDTDEVGELWQAERTFEPNMTESERTERLAAWHRAVERARGWAGD
jgi:glycerol kinase